MSLILDADFDLIIVILVFWGITIQLSVCLNYVEFHNSILKSLRFC